MDPDLRQEVLDVRKVIERSTSKVSLRDLEQNGPRLVAARHEEPGVVDAQWRSDR